MTRKLILYDLYCFFFLNVINIIVGVITVAECHGNLNDVVAYTRQNNHFVDNLKCNCSFGFSVNTEKYLYRLANAKGEKNQRYQTF